ncbi:hypothetical protein LCGC14_1850690 [marine sediment metagenome]|uniref:Uncharacterized protein n=1 Tax=marine sediment metagenome TaxID=412755 RepID=A0A0F9GAS1_9ZZZZ
MMEYKLVERDVAHELSEWDLDQLGLHGWILSAIHPSTKEVVVEYNVSVTDDVLVYHFYRPKQRMIYR